MLHLNTIDDTVSDNSWMALRSMQYFEDADTQEQLDLIKPFPEWIEIENFLMKTVNDFKFDA